MPSWANVYSSQRIPNVSHVEFGISMGPLRLPFVRCPPALYVKSLMGSRLWFLRILDTIKATSGVDKPLRFERTCGSSSNGCYPLQ